MINKSSQNSDECPVTINQPVENLPTYINKQVKLSASQLPNKISGKTSSSLFTIGITSNMSQSGLDEGGPVHAVQIDFNQDKSSNPNHRPTYLSNKVQEDVMNLRMRVDITLQNKNSDSKQSHVYIDDKNTYDQSDHSHQVKANKRRNIMQQQFNSQNSQQKTNINQIYLTNANLTGTNSSESLQNYKYKAIEFNPKLHAYKNTIDQLDFNRKNIGEQQQSSVHQNLFQSIKRIQQNFNNLNFQSQNQKEFKQHQQNIQIMLQNQNIQIKPNLQRIQSEKPQKQIHQSIQNDKFRESQNLKFQIKDQQQENKNSKQFKGDKITRFNQQQKNLKNIIEQQITKQSNSKIDLNQRQFCNIPLKQKSKQSNNFLQSISFKDQIYKTQDKFISLQNDTSTQKKEIQVKQLLIKKNLKIQNKSMIQKKIGNENKLVQKHGEIKKNKQEKSHEIKSRNKFTMNQIITLTSQSQQSQMSNYMLSQENSSQNSNQSVFRENNTAMQFLQNRNRGQRRMIQQQLYHQKIITSANNSNHNETSEDQKSFVNQQNMQDQFIVIENQEHLSPSQNQTPKKDSFLMNLQQNQSNVINECKNTDLDVNIQEKNLEKENMQNLIKENNCSNQQSELGDVNSIISQQVEEIPAYQNNDVEQSLLSETLNSQRTNNSEIDQRSSILTKVLVKSDIDNSENFLKYNESMYKGNIKRETNSNSSNSYIRKIKPILDNIATEQSQIMFEQRDYSRKENMLINPQPLFYIDNDNHDKNVIVSEVTHSQYTFEGKIEHKELDKQGEDSILKLQSNLLSADSQFYEISNKLYRDCNNQYNSINSQQVYNNFDNKVLSTDQQEKLRMFLSTEIHQNDLNIKNFICQQKQDSTNFQIINEAQQYGMKQDIETHQNKQILEQDNFLQKEEQFRYLNNNSTLKSIFSSNDVLNQSLFFNQVQSSSNKFKSIVSDSLKTIKQNQMSNFDLSNKQDSSSKLQSQSQQFNQNISNLISFQTDSKQNMLLQSSQEQQYKSAFQNNQFYTIQAYKNLRNQQHIYEQEQIKDKMMQNSKILDQPDNIQARNEQSPINKTFKQSLDYDQQVDKLQDANVSKMQSIVSKQRIRQVPVSNTPKILRDISQSSKNSQSKEENAQFKQIHQQIDEQNRDQNIIDMYHFHQNQISYESDDMHSNFLSIQQDPKQKNVYHVFNREREIQLQNYQLIRNNNQIKLRNQRVKNQSDIQQKISSSSILDLEDINKGVQYDVKGRGHYKNNIQSLTHSNFNTVQPIHAYQSCNIQSLNEYPQSSNTNKINKLIRENKKIKLFNESIFRNKDCQTITLFKQNKLQSSNDQKSQNENEQNIQIYNFKNLNFNFQPQQQAQNQSIVFRNRQNQTHQEMMLCQDSDGLLDEEIPQSIEIQNNFINISSQEYNQQKPIGPRNFRDGFQKTKHLQRINQSELRQPNFNKNEQFVNSNYNDVNMGKNLSASMGYRDNPSKNQKFVNFRLNERINNQGKIEQNNIEGDQQERISQLSRNRNNKVSQSSNLSMWCCLKSKSRNGSTDSLDFNKSVQGLNSENKSSTCSVF